MLRPDLEGIYVAVVSTGRPEAVEKMTELVGAATWYTRPGDEYGDVKLEGLCAARNRALDDAFALDAPCLQLSDDLTKLEILAGGQVSGASFSFVAGVLSGELALSDARLAGVAPTANPFYASEKVKRRHFIVGDLVLVLPTDLRYDERLPLKEDYDYTCQHIERYGCVCRVDWALAHFKHRSNPGGAVAVRTPALEQKAIALLAEKWPGWIKPNPRRENEVLLRPPKAARG